jgi:shikimate kinase
MERPLVILVGFMGTGKSSTGACLAGLLGFGFLDTDQELEREAGCSIPSIFRDRGEAAFREMERKLLGRILDRDRLVVATGGGLWMDPTNRSRLRAAGFTVHLQASATQIWDRVKGDLAGRPLLASAPDPQARIQELLRSRMSAYAEAHVEVPTDGRTPLEVAEWVREILEERHPFDLPPLPS